MENMQFVHTRFFCSLLLINLLESFVFTLCMINKVSVYGTISVLGTDACNSTYSHGERRPLWTKPHQVRFCLGWCLFQSRENIAYHKYYGIDESHLGCIRSSATVFELPDHPPQVLFFQSVQFYFLFTFFFFFFLSLHHISLVQTSWEEAVKSQGSTLCMYIQLSVQLNSLVNHFSCMTEHVLCGRHFYEVP